MEMNVENPVPDSVDETSESSKHGDFDTSNTFSEEDSKDIIKTKYSYALNNDSPAQMGKYLQFLCINSSGHLLLGSSDLTHRYWGGSIWYYKNPLLAPSIEESDSAMEFHYGVNDCAFINESTAVIGMDGGVIDFIRLKNFDDDFYMEKLDHIDDHGDAVLCVKITCDNKSILTASRDMCIRHWDAETLCVKNTYNPAHNLEITSLSAHPTHPELFLSASFDGNVLMWDVRLPRPATCVYRDLQKIPTCVSWTKSLSRYIVGCVNGDVILRDASNISNDLDDYKSFQRSIYSIQFSPYKKNEFIIGANESQVQVCSMNDDHIKMSYTDDRHDDFVRGLAWLDENSFLSSSWDGRILKHTI